MKFPAWLVALSIRVNELTAGPKGASLCARFWQWRLDGRFLADELCSVVDALFWFDPQHCRKSYQLHRVEKNI